MGEPRVPAGLLDAVERDLTPVRPLAAPSRRALLLLPLGLALLVGLPAFWGWRNNLAALGPAAAWGLSAVQALAGLWIAGAALREAVPGRELSATAVAGAVGAALALFVGLTLATELLVPTPVPPGAWLRYAWECFGMATVWSVPALVVVAWLASRALPTRPAVAGALYGLGTGLMADAGVRLFCRVSSPAHVLVAHGGAILFLVVAGACAATAVERRKARAASKGAS
ncbi:MAG TPA: NrsF family protein [Thermoanaerobaculia bacterium]|nr:NrsF family protein [Thermoanaerobaculia bacterium]